VARFSIDGMPPATTNTSASGITCDHQYFVSDKLADGNHTLTISIPARGNYFGFTFSRAEIAQIEPSTYV
jgi:hypothetical protein